MNFIIYTEKFYENMILKNYSSLTIKLRRMHMNRFINWCEQRGITRIEEVNRYVVERFQKYLMYSRMKAGKRISIRSQKGYLVTVKMFFKFLTFKRYLEYNPANDIEMPKIPKEIPKAILTLSEVHKIFNSVDLNDINGIRDRAILEVLYSTGIRRMEIASICIYDIDFENGTIFIRLGKGKKDRIIPISSRALHWLKKYIYEQRPETVFSKDPQTVFLSLKGIPMTLEHYSRMVRKYVLKAEITKKGSCHLFRHTMASLMHENGADIRYVQEMLGHADISTTQIYTRINVRKLKEIHTKTLPDVEG